MKTSPSILKPHNQATVKKICFCGLCFLFVSLSNCLNAQNNGLQKQQTDSSIYLKVYYQSVAMDDFNTAIEALHYVLASDPEKYSNWKDTLALLYVRNNSFQQANVLSSALLDTKGYTDLRMEIRAICAKALQQPAEAIDAYSILYSKTNKIAYGFEELRLQYSIRRLTETIATGNSLLQNIPPTNKDFVSVVKADGKTPQQVSLKAAVCNLLGLAYADLKDKTNAKEQFESALKENPDFELAKNNLAVTESAVDNAKK